MTTLFGLTGRTIEPVAEANESDQRNYHPPSHPLLLCFYPTAWFVHYHVSLSLFFASALVPLTFPSLTFVWLSSAQLHFRSHYFSFHLQESPVLDMGSLTPSPNPLFPILLAAIYLQLLAFWVGGGVVLLSSLLPINIYGKSWRICTCIY